MDEMSRIASFLTVLTGALKKASFGLGTAALIAFLSAEAWAVHVTFNETDLGAFPTEWRAREQGGKKVYSVQQDAAGVFLHAESIANAHAIGREISVDLEEFPFLNFSWRAVDLPEGGREGVRETNDGALGVYVVFEGWSLPPRTVKYVWSTSLPVGTVTTSPFSKKSQIVVLRSGDAGLGEWVEETVDVLGDYRKLFGEDAEVPRVKAIGILTDSDNTGTQATGDYRSFRFLTSRDKLAARER